MSKKGKAVSMISGGLDSILATKIIIELGFEVVGLTFKSEFSLPHRRDNRFTPEKVCDRFDIPLKIIENTKEMFEMVRNPKFGVGQGLNPCVDCRIMLIKRAVEYMKEISADFVVTGEVVGQRPMSQLMKHIKLINRKTGLEDYLIRPLSAKLLPDNEIIKKGLIDKEQLYDINGRSRKPQIRLAKKFGITDYPDSAGGCLLTDKRYCKKLEDYIKYFPDDDLNHLSLLLIGRHFRLNERVKFIIGRNKIENDKLEENSSNGIILDTVSQGPVTLILGNPTEEEIEYIAQAHARYCDDEINIKIKCIDSNKNENFLSVNPLSDGEVKKYLI